MNSRERINRQIAGLPVDRIPKLGGWVLGTQNVCTMAGISLEEYGKDPVAGVRKMNKRLGVDALLPLRVIPDPVNLEQIRTAGYSEASFSFEAEDLLAYAEKIPDTREQLLAERFNAAEVRSTLTAAYEKDLLNSADFVMIPNNWMVTANFALYHTYGYEAYLEAIALYPEAVEKIYWESAVIARETNLIHIELIKKYDLPRMMFCGHDICNQTGPMCSPKFLRDHFWKHNKYALEPFVNEGIRLVHHCDGNIMPIFDDMIESGFSGFQGFQYECTVDPYELAARRGPNGERLLFLAGLSVTRTLPFGTVDEVKQEVDFCLDYTDGGKGLFLFTSNVVGVEVPPENLLTAYDYMSAIDPAKWKPKGIKTWPWAGRECKTLLRSSHI
jgi:hypothetical protein